MKCGQWFAGISFSFSYLNLLIKGHFMANAQFLCHISQILQCAHKYSSFMLFVHARAPVVVFSIPEALSIFYT